MAYMFILRLTILGLFHRAIAQSGSCLNSWAFTNSSKSMAFRLGEKLGIKTEDSQELLNHLRSVGTMDLTKASHEVLTPEASVYTTTTNCPTPTQSLLHLRHYVHFLTN
jgi:carboxylesterase type B